MHKDQKKKGRKGAVSALERRMLALLSYSTEKKHQRGRAQRVEQEKSKVRRGDEFTILQTR